jgi:hypothetical protein
MSNRFDDLTRIIASEMPRREALKLAARVLVGTALAVALPFGPTRPGRSWAAPVVPRARTGSAPDCCSCSGNRFLCELFDGSTRDFDDCEQGEEIASSYFEICVGPITPACYDSSIHCCFEGGVRWKPVCGPVHKSGRTAQQKIYGPIASITLIKAENCTVNLVTDSFPGTPMGTTDPPRTFDPPRNSVTIYARKPNDRKAVVEVKVCSAVTHSCCVRCDPVDVTLPGGQRWGSMKIITGVHEVDSKVLVLNLAPGLTALTAVVNGRRFRVSGLQDDEELTIDVASAMKPGETNEFVLRAEGPQGSSAHVLIWDGVGDPQTHPNLVRSGRAGQLGISP